MHTRDFLGVYRRDPGSTAQMIASCSDISNFLQLRKLDGSELGRYFLGEAKDSIVTLVL